MPCGTRCTTSGQEPDFLLLSDPDVLPIMLGAFAAHRFGGTPVWLLIVAPPSGTETELLRALWSTTGVYPLSELTSKTFASGLETHGEGPSLLHRLTNEVLVLRDLTTVLEMYQEERQAILVQLREIYDRRFDKAWGTGKELHWQGRLGFLAGVTRIIDSYYADSPHSGWATAKMSGVHWEASSRAGALRQSTAVTSTHTFPSPHGSSWGN